MMNFLKMIKIKVNNLKNLNLKSKNNWKLFKFEYYNF